MAAYATVTLTGTYQTPDGTPHKGTVEIIPSERVIKDTTGDVILTGRVKVQLGHPAAEGEAGAENGWVHDGKFTVALPATDDPTLNPTGFGYTLAAKLHSTHLPAVSFALPAATPAVDVEDVTPVDPSTFTPDTTYVEPADLATVATTGNYSDLTGQPTIPTTPADLGAEPAGLSQATNDQLAATIAAQVETGAPTPQGLGLRMAVESDLPAVLVVQGDSTGNANDEWVYLTTQALAAAYPTHRVLHRLWNMTTLAYDTPTVVQAATEGYFVPTSTDQVHLNNTGAVAISGDLTIRAKVRATEVTSGSRRQIAAKWGGNSTEQSFWFYIDATNGLTLGWQTETGAFRSAAVASNAALDAAFTDGTDFYIGAELDVDNGAGQYAVRGLQSTDGVTWTTLGTPVTGTTGTTSVKTGTGFLKVGGRGTTGGNTEPWNGRIYWLEVCAGSGANAAIKARFEPGLSTRTSTWTDAEGNPWVKTASGVTVGSPLLLVLNASSPGMDADYSVTHFATQVPRLPALTILSYSHNGPSSVQQADYAGVIYAPLLDRWATDYPSAPVMVTLQSPQASPRTANDIEDHNLRVRGVARLAASRNLAIIDAYTPIKADTATYVDPFDGVHPTAEGEQVWAEAVRQALRPAIPVT